MSTERTRRASRSAYMHGSVAPDLRGFDTPDFEVVPGRRAGRDTAAMPASILGIVRVVVVVALVVAALCCVRVALAAESVSTTIATDGLSTQIENARSAGNDLEVQQSQLSNAMSVRAAAESLGMGAPASTEAVVLGPDVVATDAAGNLSLSESLSAAQAAAQG